MWEGLCHIYSTCPQTGLVINKYYMVVCKWLRILCFLKKGENLKIIVLEVLARTPYYLSGFQIICSTLILDARNLDTIHRQHFVPFDCTIGLLHVYILHLHSIFTCTCIVNVDRFGSSVLVATSSVAYLEKEIHHGNSRFLRKFSILKFDIIMKWT